MTLAQQTRKILDSVLYLTLATVDRDGQPWNTPVYAAFDARYRFFWTSAPTSQHSKNIKTNARVFVVVYDSTQRERTGVGVFMQGRAEELNQPADINHALTHFYRRKNRPPRSIRDFLGRAPRRFYRFTPTRAWINTYRKVRGQGVDLRIPVRLRG